MSLVHSLLRPRLRREPFGWTVEISRPRLLVLLGRKQEQIDPAAPYEVHLTIGHRCSQGCRGCYIDARPDAVDSMSDADWTRVLERLARLGVFHLALGAGEDVPLQRLVNLATRARRLGMLPNLSTSGRQLTPRLVERLRVFEQVHLNLDGTGTGAATGLPPWPPGRLLVLRLLRAYHPRVGVNLVLTRHNCDHLPEVFRALRRERVRSIELLRYKPAGRGRRDYADMALTRRQGRRLVRRVLALSLRWLVTVRLDCSFAPFVCAAGFSPALLRRIGLAGCVGGSWLLSVDGRGRLSACSFHQPRQPPGHEQIGTPGLFGEFRDWIARAPEPCRSCRYLSICRGGCHVVAEHVSGTFYAPDPECPLLGDDQAGISYPRG